MMGVTVMKGVKGMKDVKGVKSTTGMALVKHAVMTDTLSMSCVKTLAFRMFRAMTMLLMLYFPT
jgi:hypothetical protein